VLRVVLTLSTRHSGKAASLDDVRFHALAEKQPAKQHDPDRRGCCEERRVGDARVCDRRVPEEQGAGEGKAREDRRGGKALRRPLRPVCEPRPGPQHRQSQRHAPKRRWRRGRRWQAALRSAYPDRNGARDERREGRKPGERPHDIRRAEIQRTPRPCGSRRRAKGKPLVHSVQVLFSIDWALSPSRGGCSLAGVAARSRARNGSVTTGSFGVDAKYPCYGYGR
jgi:hypothetical protein